MLTHKPLLLHAIITHVYNNHSGSGLLCTHSPQILADLSYSYSPLPQPPPPHWNFQTFLRLCLCKVKTPESQGNCVIIKTAASLMIGYTMESFFGALNFLPWKTFEYVNQIFFTGNEFCLDNRVIILLTFWWVHLSLIPFETSFFNVFFCCLVFIIFASLNCTKCIFQSSPFKLNFYRVLLLSRISVPQIIGYKNL